MAQAAKRKTPEPQPWLALVAWSPEPERFRQLSLFTDFEDLVIDIAEVEEPVPDDLQGMYYVG